MSSLQPGCNKASQLVRLTVDLQARFLCLYICSATLADTMSSDATVLAGMGLICVSSEGLDDVDDDDDDDYDYDDDDDSHHEIRR